MRPRPGIIPLRPLMLGDIYSGVMTAIRGNLAATMGTSLIVTLVTTIPASLLAWAIIRGRAFAGSEISVATDAIVGIAASMLPTLVQSLSAFLLSGFMAYVIGEGALGRKVTPGQVWAGVHGRLATLVAANLFLWALLAVAVIVAAAAPIALLATAFSQGTPSDATIGMAVVVMVPLLGAVAVGGIFAYTRLAVLNPVIVLERSAMMASIKRTWGLTKGSWWRIAGITLVTGVIVAVASAAIQVPISMATDAALSVSPSDLRASMTSLVLQQSLGGLITGTLFTPFSAGVVAALYLDLRFRREGLDVQLLAIANEGSRHR